MPAMGTCVSADSYAIEFATECGTVTFNVLHCGPDKSAYISAVFKPVGRGVALDVHPMLSLPQKQRRNLGKARFHDDGTVTGSRVTPQGVKYDLTHWQQIEHSLVFRPTPPPRYGRGAYPRPSSP